MLLALSAAGAVAQTLRCAQPLSNGVRPLASDCLFILRAAVGLQVCSPACVCAPTGTLPAKASDALLCLNNATGILLALNCPCGPVCVQSDCDIVGDACDDEVVTAKTESDTACPSETGEERTECLARGAKAADAGDRVCDAFRTDCLSCCQSSGTNCTLAPEVPRVVGTFEIPDRRILEGPNLPPGPGGVGFMLLPLPDGELGFDPSTRTPATAAAECVGAVLACFSPGERNWAGCLAVVPTCPTDRPWEDSGPSCCTQACLDRYEQLRRTKGTNPAAFTAAIYEAPSCMEGVDAFTEREVPP